MYYEESFKPLQLVIEKGKITNILPYDSLKADVDYGENKILPGLIDIHNHGYLGCDANHATVDWVKKWMNYLAKEEGVTSTLPAVSSCEKVQILDGSHNETWNKSGYYQQIFVFLEEIRKKPPMKISYKSWHKNEV